MNFEQLTAYYSR